MLDTSATGRRIRFNSGYWDGRSDRDTGRYAEWSRCGLVSRHPFDRLYGEGYWAGRYDPDSPETSDAAWKARR